MPKQTPLLVDHLGYGPDVGADARWLRERWLKQYAPGDFAGELQELQQQLDTMRFEMSELARWAGDLARRLRAEQRAHGRAARSRRPGERA